MKKFTNHAELKNKKKLRMNKSENNMNFIQVEKILLSKIHTNMSDQIEFEFSYYGRNYNLNYSLYNTIEKIIHKALDNIVIFSKQQVFIQDFLFFNCALLKKNNIETCHRIYSVQLITNWVLLSFNTNLIDRTFFDNKQLNFERYDCINRFSNYFDLYLNYYNKDYKSTSKDIEAIKIISFVIFKKLNEEKVITSKTRKFKTKATLEKKRQSVIKTYKFYTLNNYSLYNNRINFNVYLTRPKIKLIKNTYYYIGVHYSTMTKIFKTNVKSNKSFGLYNIELLRKIASLQYKIDYKMFDYIYNLICKDLKIEGNIQKHIIENLKEFYNSELYNEISDDEHQNLQVKHSRYLLYYVFSQIKPELGHLENFFLASSFDFRGRIYSKSCISPIGNSIFRFLYYYGYYTSEELNSITNYKITTELKNLILNANFLKNFKNIDLHNELNIKYIYICIFEIGKLNKNTLLKNKHGRLEDLDFIISGINLLNMHTDKPNFEDFDIQIQYKYLLLGLEDLNRGLYKKIIIYKDATASGIQLLTLILGGLNENIILNCNLNSKTH